jgi:hypothetical protein
MRRAALLAFAVGFGVLVPISPALATTFQTFFDRNAFLAAVGSTNSSLFLTANPASNINGTSMGGGQISYDGSANAMQRGDFSSLLSGNEIAFSGVEQFVITAFSAGYGIGIDMVEPHFTTATGPDAGVPWVQATYSVLAYSQNVTLLGFDEFGFPQFVVSETDVATFTFTPPDDQASFVGIWSDTPFKSLKVHDLSGSGHDELFGNVYYALSAMPQAAVPEPTGVLLLGAAAVVCGARGRRRRGEASRR